VLELRMKIRESLEQEASRGHRADVLAKILDELLKHNEFLVPQAIIDDEIMSLLMRYGIVDPAKVDPRKIDVAPFREKMGEVALKRVRTAIIVDRIGEIEKVALEKSEVEAAFEETAKSNGVPVEEVRKFYSTRERLTSFVAEATRNKILDLLVGRAKVTYSAPEKS